MDPFRLHFVTTLHSSASTSVSCLPFGLLPPFRPLLLKKRLRLSCLVSSFLFSHAPDLTTNNGCLRLVHYWLLNWFWRLSCRGAPRTWRSRRRLCSQGRALKGLINKGAKAVEWDVEMDEETLVKKAKEADKLVAGWIAVVVNNAGMGIWGGAEEQPLAEFRSVFEVNVFGLVKTTRAFLPLLRSRRNGTIVNLSSIAGLSGGAGYAAYSAAKHAVVGFSDSLAKEVAHLNIRVLLVNPGYFRTNFLSAKAPSFVGSIEDYSSVLQPVQDGLAAFANQQPGDPVLGARAIVDVVLSEGEAKEKGWSGRLLLGPDALQVMQDVIKEKEREMEHYRVISHRTDLEEVKRAKAEAVR